MKLVNFKPNIKLSVQLSREFIFGILFIAILSVISMFVADLGFFKSYRISPLVIGIVIGMLISNIAPKFIPEVWSGGILFCAKRILRLAIVFYGFRISFQQVIEVGLEGFMVSLFMVVSTFVIGTWVGTRIFKMDSRLSMLTASGASVCGAAAVLATEPIVKAKPHESAIAVAQVVLFGTIAMFLYPALYASGWMGFDAGEFGIYIGGTVHEVAQVVAAGSAVSIEAESVAVIVKMTRVILLAPALIALGLYLSFRKSDADSGKVKLIIPWFAVAFLAMIGFNSLDLLAANIVDTINIIDTFMLVMAMTALGTETRFNRFKATGMAPFYTSFIMFLWLVFGGAALVFML